MKNLTWLSHTRTGLLCALLTASTSCAQLLGTGDYKEATGNGDRDAATDRDDPQQDDNTQHDSGRDDATSEEPSHDAEAGSSTEPLEGGTGATSSEAEAGADDPTDDTTDDTADDTTGDDTSPPDEAGTCVAPGAGTCDTFPQCGCEDNEACAVLNTVSGDTGCVLPGSIEPYSACTQPVGDCQTGYGCIGGVCKPHCDGHSAAECGEGSYGACIQVTADGADIPEYFVCERTCDPVDPTRTDDTYTACGHGANCIAGPNGVSSCIAAGSGSAGTSCATELGPNPYLCAPGLACVDLGDAALCLRNCERGSDDCGAGSSCLPYATEIGAAERSIGYCSECNVPAISDCDAFSQCGCGSEEMCAIVDVAAGQAQCMNAGDGQLGQTCSTALGQCEPGLDCVLWNLTGSCTPFCHSNADCPGANPLCVVWPGTGVGQCLQGCDPRNPTSNEGPFQACQEGQSCAIWYEFQNGQCLEPSYPGVEGEACENEDQCSAGLTCAGNGGLSCARWCALEGDDCLPDEECLPDYYYRAAGEQTSGSVYLESAGVSLGHCALPLVIETSTVPLPIPDATEGTDEPGVVRSEIVVPVMPSGTRVSQVRVLLDIEHGYVGDLYVTLTSPTNTTRVLLDGIYFVDATGTALLPIFDDAATTPITEGFAPFDGVYQPAEPLWTLLGSDPSGTWTLSVSDVLNGDEGTLNSWTLVIF